MDNIKLTNYKSRLNKFYFEKAKPILAKYNTQININNKTMVVIGIYIVAFCCFVLACIFGSFVLFGLFALIIFLLFALSENVAGVYAKPTEYKFTDVDKKMKKELMSDFCNIFNDLQWGDTYSLLLKSGKTSNSNLHQDKTISNQCKRFSSYVKYKGRQKLEESYIDKFKKLYLLNCLFLHFDDILIGSHEGINFKILKSSILPSAFQWVYILIFGLPLFPIMLIYLSVKCFQIKFKGLIIEFDLKDYLNGHTVIIERGEAYRSVKIPKDTFEEVDLGDKEFMSEYHVFSDNQPEARFLLTPVIIENLKKLQSDYKAKYMRVVFKDNKITIALDIGKDVLKFADSFNNEIMQQNFILLFNEIISILDFIEQLKLNKRISVMKEN